VVVEPRSRDRDHTVTVSTACRCLKEKKGASIAPRWPKEKKKEKDGKRAFSASTQFV